jgi:hypothetical protein
MKKVLILILGLFLGFGCTKPLIDYRSKYVGTYNVISYNSSWVMGQVQQNDTISYTLKIKRSTDKYVVDFISPNGSTSYLLEKDGTLHYESNDWHYHVSGYFTNKNHFHLTGGYYGLGGGNSFDATGTKQ